MPTNGNKHYSSFSWYFLEFLFAWGKTKKIFSWKSSHKPSRTTPNHLELTKDITQLFFGAILIAILAIKAIQFFFIVAYMNPYDMSVRVQSIIFCLWCDFKYISFTMFLYSVMMLCIVSFKIFTPNFFLIIYIDIYYLGANLPILWTV